VRVFFARTQNTKKAQEDERKCISKDRRVYMKAGHMRAYWVAQLEGRKRGHE